MDLGDVVVRPVTRVEEGRYQALLEAHHYLGSLPKIGETLWYVATYGEVWVALLSFSAAALKCGVRDRWIGWDFRIQYDRLKLLANNSRFLILPEWHYQNLGSKVLSLCAKRLPADWQAIFGHPLVLLETFVDPEHFHGTVYQAANWTYVGNSRGFSRTRAGYSATAATPKKVFLKVLDPGARKMLPRPVLDPRLQIGVPKMTLSAEQMLALPDFFKNITDPRRGQGRRHRMATVLALVAAATLSGMRGYKEMAEWVDGLSQRVLARFRCRRVDGHYVAPCLSTIRDVLIRVDPQELDSALQAWDSACGATDSALAVDGKTMKNALDDDGRQTHILSAVGHDSKVCFAQKKLAVCR